MPDQKPTLDYATPRNPQPDSDIDVDKLVTAMLMFSAVIAGLIGSATGVELFNACACGLLALMIASGVFGIIVHPLLKEFMIWRRNQSR